MANLNLLPAGETSIGKKEIIFESHKRNVGATHAYQALVDLSHPIEDGLITYKGLPAPVICDYLSREDSKNFYEEGTSFQIGKIEMVTNTGTYLDCPFHRFENGDDLSEVVLERCTDLDAIVIRVPFTETLEITEAHFKDHVVSNRAVLVNTGWRSIGIQKTIMTIIRI